MRAAMLVLAMMAAACRVVGDGDADADGDAWSETDADVEAEPLDAAWCSYQAICAGVECSRLGVCEVDITCRPSCLCFVGYHADGIECVSD
jgi:hypothetical protein